MIRFLLETFVVGINSLRLHKLRSLLTALGIIIGVGAVIIMVAIGEGAKQDARKQMEQLGAQNIVIRSIRPPESTEASSRTQRILDYGLKRVDLENIRTLLEDAHVANVIPLRDTEQPVVYANKRAFANAVGTTSEAFEVINLKLARGRLFTKMEANEDDAPDMGGPAPVCVMGATAADQIFPLESPVGRQILVGSASGTSVLLTVIGVLEPTGLRPGSEGASMVRSLDQDIYFPLSLAQTVFGDSIVRRQAGSMERKQIELTEIWIKANRTDQVEDIASIATNILQRRHGEKIDFEVKAPVQILRNAERLNRLFNMILIAIASVSLIVGGIGIMNIMLATVTERTREIGIRRALGAKRRHITLQFLIETTVISLMGALIGIALGIVVAIWLPDGIRFFAWLFSLEAGTIPPTRIAQWSIVSSFIVSGLIGIGFGLYPAIMAARMNPIEALRHE